MNRWTLSDASYEALLRLADTYGAEVPENVTRDELEEIVAEAAEEWQAEHRQGDSHSIRMERTKYDVQAVGESEYRAVEEVELPESYNETRIVLMLRDPSWAFAYWDLRASDRSAFHHNEDFQGLVLRVYSMDSDVPLEAAQQRFDIPVTLLDARWYINLPDQETRYRIALVGLVGREERQLAVSNVIAVPRVTIADSPHDDGEPVRDAIIAQTGIHDLDLPPVSRRIPQRILDLIDEDLLFN